MFQEFDNKDIKHAYHLILIVINKKKTKKKRDNLVNYLKRNKIGCGINYRCVTNMSIYRKMFSWDKNTCLNSKYIGDNTLSLPLHPTLTLKEVNYICEKIHKYFKA